MVFRTEWRFRHFRFFIDFVGDFGSVLVEKNVWPFLVEKMGSLVDGFQPILQSSKDY